MPKPGVTGSHPSAPVSLLRRCKTLFTPIKRRAIRRAFASADGCLELCGVRRPLVVLIMGHMRSGSTLLLHLLVTNPEVAALGERNNAYAARADLARLAITCRVALRAPLRPLRYVVDQVNHNKFTPNIQLLSDPRVRLIFLLRRPEASIASIVELARVFYGGNTSVAQAADYYVERLGALRKIAASLSHARSAIFVRYETLTESPDATLATLSQFLALPGGFSSHYTPQIFTGRRGDPGPRIRSGRVLCAPLPPIGRLAAAELERATRAYVECGDALTRFESPVPTPGLPPRGSGPVEPFRD